MKISISATKKQQNIAKLLFGAKHQTILKQLEKYSKEKLFNTEQIDLFLTALKTLTSESAEKLSSSAAGKKVISNFKAVAVAKSFDQIMKAIKTAKCPKALQNPTASNVPQDQSKAIASELKRVGIKTRNMPLQHLGVKTSVLTVMDPRFSDIGIVGTPKAMQFKFKRGGDGASWGEFTTTGKEVYRSGEEVLAALAKYPKGSLKSKVNPISAKPIRTLAALRSFIFSSRRAKFTSPREFQYNGGNSGINAGINNYIIHGGPGDFSISKLGKNMKPLKAKPANTDQEVEKALPALLLVRRR